MRTGGALPGKTSVADSIAIYKEAPPLAELPSHRNTSSSESPLDLEMVPLVTIPSCALSPTSKPLSFIVVELGSACEARSVGVLSLTGRNPEWPQQTQ